MIGALLHDFDRQNVTLLLATGQVAFRLSPGQSGYRWNDIFVYALRIGKFPVSHPAPRVIWSQAGDRWCGISQVVKAALSRELTERTLLTALSQLLWPDKGREVWFSLGENHEKACRFGLHQLRNCLRGNSCPPQAPSRSAGTLRKDSISHF
jgi:hypothetical protein